MLNNLKVYTFKQPKTTRNKPIVSTNWPNLLIINPCDVIKQLIVSNN